MANNLPRDWARLDGHYQRLLGNINRELTSPHHTRAAHEAVAHLCEGLEFESVVELGCATGPTLDAMRAMGKKTFGITFKDEPNSHEVLREDMHFTSLKDKSFDLVATRHVLEHSPMPLLLLLEMRRIAKKYALLILPTETERMIWTWTDHYFVLSRSQWEKLFEVAGFKIAKFEQAKYLEYEAGKWDEEYRWLLKV